jgi:hypothetical protein
MELDLALLGVGEDLSELPESDELADTNGSTSIRMTVDGTILVHDRLERLRSRRFRRWI